MSKTYNPKPRGGIAHCSLLAYSLAHPWLGLARSDDACNEAMGGPMGERGAQRTGLVSWGLWGGGGAESTSAPVAQQ